MCRFRNCYIAESGRAEIHEALMTSRARLRTWFDVWHVCSTLNPAGRSSWESYTLHERSSRSLRFFKAMNLDSQRRRWVTLRVVRGDPSSWRQTFFSVKGQNYIIDWSLTCLLQTLPCKTCYVRHERVWDDVFGWNPVSCCMVDSSLFIVTSTRHSEPRSRLRTVLPWPLTCMLQTWPCKTGKIKVYGSSWPN